MSTRAEVHELMEARREYATYWDLCKRLGKHKGVKSRENFMTMLPGVRAAMLASMRKELEPFTAIMDELDAGDDDHKQRLKATKKALKQLADKRDIGEHEDWGKF